MFPKKKMPCDGDLATRGCLRRKPCEDDLSKVSISSGIISGSLIRSKYIAWYDFGILYLYKVYCLLWFQDPLSVEKYIGGISGSSILPMYIAWYSVYICDMETWYEKNNEHASQMIRKTDFPLKKKRPCDGDLATRGCPRRKPCEDVAPPGPGPST